MGRNAKFNKEIKIQACKDYEEGYLGFRAISKEIGANEETVRRWYLIYKEHGPSAFESLNKNSSYSREFKLSIVEEYTSGTYSLTDLATKHNVNSQIKPGNILTLKLLKSKPRSD